MKRTDIIVLAAGLLMGAGLAVIFYYGLDLGGKDRGSREYIESGNIPVSPAVGSTAPDFTLSNLNDEEFNITEMRGKIVVLNFWATWCEPCKLEMPFFEELHHAGHPDLHIWGVNFDEPPQQVEIFIEELNLSFPILLDPGGDVQDLYRVRGYPTTYIVDKEGVIRFHHIGLISEGQLENYLDQLGALE